jgi:hypothetical protein
VYPLETRLSARASLGSSERKRRARDDRAVREGNRVGRIVADAAQLRLQCRAVRSLSRVRSVSRVRSKMSLASALFAVAVAETVAVTVAVVVAGLEQSKAL